VKNQITKGEWVVRGVVKVDDDTRQIWFSASGMYPGKDPYFVHFYRIDFDGSNLTALTEADASHEVRFSPDMTYFVDTYSRVDLPNVSELRRTADRSLVATLEKADISALLAAGWKAPEVFVAKGRDGKTDIWGVIVRPVNFDPKKKYPVIENIYAGPHSSFVPKTFWPFGPHSSGDKVIGMQQMAEMGFIVVQIDGMGTMNRSKAFHDVAWKNVGDAGFPDRILWHKAAAAKSGSTADRPEARTRSAACCSTRTSTRWRSRTTGATTTAWTRSGGTSSGWAGRSMSRTARRRTSTTHHGCRARCCSSSASST
jgi:dipeptidyl aminopeptidase/acylaminoacyl peptidase